MSVVHVVVPAGFDDPERVSGGSVYDRRVIEGLRGLGWDVRVSTGLRDQPDGGLALVDGLAAVRDPEAVEASAVRLRVVVLAHMVAADLAADDGGAERRALAAADRVVATSLWTREELVRRGLVGPDRVDLALPGADAASLAAGTATGGRLLAIGVVAPHKGHDLLVGALAGLADLDGWHCTIAGSTSAAPRFADEVAAAASDAGIADRVSFSGVLAEPGLREAYDGADLLVAPSRVESYGIAIGDALRRGIPVVATAASGIPQAFGDREAVVLVPPGEPAALTRALRSWMLDPVLRERLRAAAARERDTLPRWADTVARIAQILEDPR